MIAVLTKRKNAQLRQQLCVLMMKDLVKSLVISYESFYYNLSPRARIFVKKKM